MFSNMEFVRELGSQFKLFRTSSGAYEVYPNDSAWTCMLRGRLGGNVDDAWVYRSGEVVYVFVRDGDTFEKYHFDFWAAMLNEVDRREPFDTYTP